MCTWKSTSWVRMHILFCVLGHHLFGLAHPFVSGSCWRQIASSKWSATSETVGIQSEGHPIVLLADDLLPYANKPKSKKWCRTMRLILLKVMRLGEVGDKVISRLITCRRCNGPLIVLRRSFIWVAQVLLRWTEARQTGPHAYLSKSSKSSRYVGVAACTNIVGT